METNAKEVKRYLKSRGIDTKNVRCRVEHFGYGSMSINVTLKDITLDIFKINELLQKEYSDIRYDEHVQGEILEGCNTYVYCNFDDEVIFAERKKQRPKAEKIYAELEKEDSYNGQTFFENEEIEAIAFFKDNRIHLRNKHGNTAPKPPRLLYSPSDIEKLLVFLENGHVSSCY
ncbi:hypothetical protein [Enterococcus alishanensis]